MFSPALRAQATYPFVELNERAAARRAAGLELVDLGVGDPREPLAPLIIQALHEGIHERMGYPAAIGLPDLRAAIARWVERRFACTLDPDRQIIPTLGSKEAIFSFASVLLDVPAGRDTVVVTEPGYPVPARAAQIAGARVVALPLLEENGFLPDLTSVDPEVWRRTALVWLNYPNNPTGALAPLRLYEELASLARDHDFVLASDEAYSELYTTETPASALELRNLRNVAVFNTLSKRSSMTGVRSGFVGGDPDIVAALRRFRPSAGTAPQEFVQRASIVAWDDEEHVERSRDRYARRRALFQEVFNASGIRVAGGDATMFMWLATPAGESSQEFAERLLSRGVLVAPGAFLGPSGEGYVRLALVASDDECVRAVELIEDLLVRG